MKGNDWKKVLKRYNPPDAEIDLIKRILTYDLQSRIRPLEALRH